MPQMMPLHWLSLFMFFILIYLMFNILNYFLFLNLPLNKTMNQFPKLKSWKW